MTVSMPPRTRLRGLSAVVACITALFVNGAAQSATAEDHVYAGTNGRILFNTGTSNNELKSIDPNAGTPSGTVVSLGSLPGPEGTAAWSPDGNRIAVSSDSAVWVMNANGTGAVKLADLPGAAYIRGLTWSPNGQRIVYNYALLSAPTGDLYVLNNTSSASTPVRVTTGALLNSTETASWSPDNVTITYSSKYNQADREIWIQRVDQTTRQQVTNDAVDQHNPTWSPNGDRIAYMVDGTTGVTLAVTGTTNMFGLGWVIGGSGNITAPAGRLPGRYTWSPDSTKLAVDYFSAGTSLLSVFTVPAFGMTPFPETLTGVQVGGSAVVWSPDGAKLAFKSPGTTEIRHLVTVNWNGTGQTVILPNVRLNMISACWQKR